MATSTFLVKTLNKSTTLKPKNILRFQPKNFENLRHVEPK